MIECVNASWKNIQQPKALLTISEHVKASVHCDAALVPAMHSLMLQAQSQIVQLQHELECSSVKVIHTQYPSSTFSTHSYMLLRFALVIHLERKHHNGSAGAATTCILLLFCASGDSTADQN